MPTRIGGPLCAVAAALVVLAACAKNDQPAATPRPSLSPLPASPSPSPSPTGEPRTYDSVKAAVDRQDAAVAARDGATMWDLLTSTGQAVMPQKQYVDVVVHCSKIFTTEKTLSIAPNNSMTAATVSSTDAAGGTFEWQMVYENGRWKHQPSDSATKWMKLGDKALGVLRDSSSCGPLHTPADPVKLSDKISGHNQGTN